MRLTVFGATGPTGREVVGQALAAGHAVVAVARRPEALTLEDSRLEVVRGDVTQPDSIAPAVAGADAVLSALGARAMRQPVTVYSAGLTAILQAMEAASVSRIVAVTAAPVAPGAEKSVLDRYLAHPLLWRFFGGGYADMAAMEQVLAQSGADWTVLRPPRLTNKPGTGHYRTAVGGPVPRGYFLPRADLAAAMLAAATDLALIGQAITIAT